MLQTLLERTYSATLPSLSIASLQSLMWDKVGIVRIGKQLEEAASILAFWQRHLPEATDRPSYELANLILTGRLMAEAALLREESRGAHYRQDFPEPLSSWEHHITIKKG